MRRLLVIALAVSAAACAPQTASPEFAEATPESQAFMLSVTGDTQAEALAPQSEGRSAQALGSGDLPEWLSDAQSGVAGLNRGVRAVLDPIADLIQSAPDLRTTTVHVWGPTDREQTTYKFTMAKAATDRFGWKLEAKTLGSDDSTYVVVMAGTFIRGDQARRGRGVLAIDLDKLSTVNATLTARGQLLLGYAHAAGYRSLSYALKGFTPDSAAFQPIDALFHGVHSPLGGNDVTVAVHANIKDTPTTAQELAVLHARWIPELGGRVDAVAFSGDVPDGHVIAGIACFTRDMDQARGFAWLGDCTAAGCTTVSTAGVPANCVRGLENASAPPADPMGAAPATMASDPAAPALPAVPTTIPTGDGN